MSYACEELSEGNVPEYNSRPTLTPPRLLPRVLKRQTSSSAQPVQGHLDEPEEHLIVLLGPPGVQRTHVEDNLQTLKPIVAQRFVQERPIELLQRPPRRGVGLGYLLSPVGRGDPGREHDHHEQPDRTHGIGEMGEDVDVDFEQGIHVGER